MHSYLLLYFSFLSHFCTAQTPSSSPCEQSFGYVLRGNDYFGVITLDRLESGRTEIKVAFSQRGTLDANNYGSIRPYPGENVQLMQAPVLFKVQFPNSKKPPKLTELSINGKIICSGPEYPPPSSWFELTYTVNTYTPNINQNPTYEPIAGPELTQPLAPRPIPTPIHPPTPPTLLTTLYSTPAPTRRASTFPIQEAVTLPQALYSNVFLAAHLQQSISQNIGPNTSPISTKKTTKTTQSTTQNTDQHISQHTIQNSTSSVTCGIEGSIVRPFLYGGSELVRGESPWLTAIYRKDAVHSLSYICGGTLISARSVVSAAHCFHNLAATQVALFLGRINLESYTEDGFVTRDVERLIKHPEYNNLPDADIAVLLMAAISSFTDFIRPICLWTESTQISTVVGRSGTVAGWGSTEKGELVSPIAKKTEVQIASEVDCLRSSAVFSKLVTNRTFCAGNRNGVGPCLGDSGSGLVLERNNRWMLRGIVSFGQTNRGLCNLYEYVVYVDVAQHLNWLMKNL